MEIFLSWSKPRSQQLAYALRDWLPEVIQQVEPWMSSESINKGQRWARELDDRLSVISQGIICVTPESMTAPWLNYEAGALAKSLSESRVHPVLLGIDESDVIGPLAQFQATRARERDDLFRLVVSLNRSCPAPLDDGRLQKAFDRTWTEFVGKLDAIPEPDTTAEPARRPNDDMLREILQHVRELKRNSEADPVGEDETVSRYDTALLAALRRLGFHVLTSPMSSSIDHVVELPGGGRVAIVLAAATGPGRLTPQMAKWVVESMKVGRIDALVVVGLRTDEETVGNLASLLSVPVTPVRWRGPADDDELGTAISGAAG